MWNCLLLALVLLDFHKDDVALKVEADKAQIDPGCSIQLVVTLKTPKDVQVEMPDFRSRVRGFSLAEDYVQEPIVAADGTTTQTAEWRLVPEPVAPAYKIAPFVIGKYWAGPIRFEAPDSRPSVEGDYELNPKKVLPPFSWRLVGQIALLLLALTLVVGVFIWGTRYLVRRVKEHRMSPIERAWVELERLLKKGLPGRGRFKDFYVELTMVVRRYVQRQYGIRAPHLTTQEFFEELRKRGTQSPERTTNLQQFLEAADLVKFAGVEATPEMADEATNSARTYLKTDAVEVSKEGGAK